MEAFSLLKYWPRNTTTSTTSGGGGGGGGGGGATSTDLLLDAGGAMSASESANANATLQSHDHDGGPFFDLEFGLPPHEMNNKQTHTSTQLQEMLMIMDHHSHHQVVHQNNIQEQECDSDDDGEFEFALSSCSSAGDANLAADPSDDLFFKGTPVSIDTTTTTTNDSQQQHAKSQFLHKSATKFRILMLKFKKKSKCNAAAATANQQPQQESLNHPAKKFLTVKFKVEDVPIMSLFSKDNSNSQKHIGQAQEVPSPSPSSSSSDSALSSTSDDKRFSKDLMQRYLNKVKPLYVRASRRYGDKPKFPPGQLTLVGSSANTPPPPLLEEKNPHPPLKPETGVSEAAEHSPAAAVVQEVNAKGQKQGNLQAGLRVVYKHLGKSRSASSATPCGAATSNRRDDSLLAEQDGIQGAILHCKRSFNASRN